MAEETEDLSLFARDDLQVEVVPLFGQPVPGKPLMEEADQPERVDADGNFDGSRIDAAPQNLLLTGG